MQKRINLTVSHALKSLNTVFVVFFLSALLVASSTVSFASPISAELQKVVVNDKPEWTVTYRLDKPAEQIVFLRNPDRSRTTRWLPQDSDIKIANYKVFTKEFDDIVNANELCDSQELEKLRLSLDQQVFTFQPLIVKIANKLQRRLLALQKRQWEFNVEEGFLDTSRLTRIIATNYGFKNK